MADDEIGPFIIPTSDGMVFHCSVERLGAKRERRWVFLDSNSLRYFGPPVNHERSAAEVQELVNEWWEGKQRLGQAGTNAAAFRARAISEDN